MHTPLTICYGSIVCALLLVGAGPAEAQVVEAGSDGPTGVPKGEWIDYAKVSFIVVVSTKRYRDAKKVAERASKALKIPLDLRGLTPHPKAQLTHTEQRCEDWGYPCYFARGRMDAGKYVSIERSDAYRGFKPGYFIVIVETGHARRLDKELERVRRVFADAYQKFAWVYQACMN